MGSPRRRDGALTDSQQRQLVALLQAEATSKERGVSIYLLVDVGFGNPLVIGALRDLGLAESRVVRPKGGSQHTAYWLTEAGVERARQLRRAPNA